MEEDQAARLVSRTLNAEPTRLIRQSLTHSGNTIYQVILPDKRMLALRISPKRSAFAFTRRNLQTLGSLGLPVPSVVGAGETGDGGSFILLDWIPGRDLLHELAGMTPAAMSDLAETVLEFQRRVGTLPQGGGFGWAPIGKSGSQRTWTEVFGPAGAPSEPDLTPLAPLRARLRRLRTAVEPWFESVRPVCFLDDLTTRNLLIENGSLRGIIDLDFVCYGDPLLQIGATLTCVTADVGAAGEFYCRELVRRAAPTGPAHRAVRFYAALWAVGFLSQTDAAAEPDRASRLAVAADRWLDDDPDRELF